MALHRVNTLMIKQILHEPVWLSRMKAEDFRVLTPLTYAHVNPCGIFELDMETRLPLGVVALKLAVNVATRLLPQPGVPARAPSRLIPIERAVRPFSQAWSALSVATRSVQHHSQRGVRDDAGLQ